MTPSLQIQLQFCTRNIMPSFVHHILPISLFNFIAANVKGQKVFLYFLSLEDGSYRLSRNVGTQLPLYAA